MGVTFTKRSDIVVVLKDGGEDFEWYPTTDEILTTVKESIAVEIGNSWDKKPPVVSVLDCGAGDCRPLEVLSNGGDMYAIEKSKILISNMPSDVFIVGTEFHETTLIDKKVSVIFCNPPYTEYEQWATKIIKEANASIVYLVIPSRWAKSASIADALNVREVDVKVLGSFDFLDADREARAKVDVLMVRLSMRGGYSDSQPKVDPFVVWFDECFSINADTDKTTDYADSVRGAEDLKDRLTGALVTGNGLIQVLVGLYNEEMMTLQNTFRAVGELDYSILKELDVNIPGLQKALAQRIEGLKHKYWVGFFDNYDSITGKLTTGSRKKMLDKLLANTSIDFTESNAYALTIWAIKNANKYYDAQLVTLVEGMVERANVVMYKSNKKTFGDEEWRYCNRGPDNFNRFGLEFRIILTRHRAIKPSGAFDYDYPNGLERTAATYLDDMMTVASNLGYQVESGSNAGLREWSSGKKHDFIMGDRVLMSVRAYMNGNIHIKFDQDFIRKLNVEFGRLKGWLKNKKEASEELNIPIEEIDFKCNYQLPSSSVLQICN